MKSTAKQSSLYPWLVFTLAAGFFFTHYFPRVAPSVMSEDLMQSFQVGGLAIGGMSAFFLLSYVGMQIPVGLLVDRFSIRYLMTAMALVAGLSCLLFASAHVIAVADLSRFIMGFSSSFAFVGTMKLASNWFPPQKLGLLAGLTQAFGMLGASGGVIIVGEVVGVYGWRLSMVVMGGMLIVLALFILAIVRDAPKGEEKAHASESVGMMQGLALVLRNPQSWLNAIFIGCLFAPTGAFAELWGPAFLKQGYGFSRHSADIAVGLVFIGWCLGGPLAGFISDKILRRIPIMLVSAICGLAAMVALIYIPNLSVMQVYALLFFYGLTNTGVGVSYALAAETNKPEISGTSIAFANMASVGIGMIFQPFIGYLLDLSASGAIVNGVPVYTLSDYRSAFLVLPLSLGLSVIFCLFVRETKCKNVKM